MSRKKTEEQELRAYLRLVPSRNGRAQKLHDLRVYEQKRQRRRARLTRLDDLDEPVKPAEQATRKATKVSKYPLALMPKSGKSRADKRKSCGLLLRNLQRFEEEPHVWLPSLRKPLPPFLLLPAELRQKALEMVLDDDAVLYPRPNSTTLNMALTCKLIAEDMRQVMKLWDRREMQVRSGLRLDRSVVDDLLRPLKAASAVLTYINRSTRTSCGRHIIFADAAGPSNEGQSQAGPCTNTAGGTNSRSLAVGPPNAQQSQRHGKDARRSKSSRKRALHSEKVTPERGNLERERPLQNEADSKTSEAPRQRQRKSMRGKRKQKAHKRKERQVLDLKDRDRKQYRDWARENVVEAAIVKERNILRKAYGLGTTAFLSDAEED
ncbi:hypothetical protein AC578_8670 [Pseudocercospora eumusae]|uniref:Uncharacterized protein n=1 Tax=Pseudocercospora eumusae TaxID=321146 RepID=A0A139HQB2_9PEZI|nr:hypothetical protein AC578_8670 [Pseudocercospora eumusae]KXT04573.1 hypothetical protein AC578_8670 [Pseudocercospora eumusae]